jgi:hypothetical protein
MRDTRFRNHLILVALVAILLRLAIVGPKIGGLVDDPDHYVDLARSLTQSHQYALRGKPTAYRPPLYPVVLAALLFDDQTPPGHPLLTKTQMSWRIAVLHGLLGAGAAYLTTIAARRFGLSPRLALVAGLIVAVDPLLVIQARAIMTETLAAFLIAWAIAASGKTGWRGAIETGLALGLAALCRPSTLACSALAIAFLLGRGSESRKTRLAHATLTSFVIVLILTPWAIRNRLVLGEFVWTTTHGGYTLALANNPDYYRDVLHGPPDAVWDETKQRAWALEITQATDGMSEPAADRWLARSGWNIMRTRPGDFWAASCARIARFWAISPSWRVYDFKTRLIVLAWNIPLFAFMLIGLSRPDSWRWPRAIVPTFLLGLSCVHFLYWTDMRMRAPLVPAIALAAVFGVSGRKKTSQENPESAIPRVVAWGRKGYS